MNTVSNKPFARGAWGTKKWEREKSKEELEKESKAQELVEIGRQFRLLAKEMNDNPEQVPFLHLPGDIFLYLTAFMGYREVIQLGRTCHRARSILLHNTIWMQQLRFFHEEVHALHDQTLLMTDLLLEHIAKNADQWTFYDRFRLEHRLYALDTVRRWDYKEITSLENGKKGVCTVELHTGQRILQSDVRAPFAERDHTMENPSSITTVYQPPMGAVLIDPGIPLLDVKILSLVTEDGSNHKKGGKPTPLRETLSSAVLLSAVEQLRAVSREELKRLDTSPLRLDHASYNSSIAVVQLPVDPAEKTYREVLTHTLTSARRRRVHLGNHHPAIRNNGQRSRNRMGQTGTVETANAERTNNNTAAEGAQCYPVNELLQTFSGLLLEITEAEAKRLCDRVLHKRNVIDNFLMKSNNEQWNQYTTGSTSSVEVDASTNFSVRTGSQIDAALCHDDLVHYYLMPEVCRRVQGVHLIGLVVVDPVRALFVVDEERVEETIEDGAPRMPDTEVEALRLVQGEMALGRATAMQMVDLVTPQPHQRRNHRIVYRHNLQY